MSDDENIDYYDDDLEYGDEYGFWSDSTNIIIVAGAVLLALPCLTCGVCGTIGGLSESNNGDGDDGSDISRAFMAWAECKDAVRPKLKAPSTAKFAPLEEVTGGPMKEEASEWLISGWVSAENAVGGRVRNEAVCKLRHQGGDDFAVISAGVNDR